MVFQYLSAKDEIIIKLKIMLGVGTMNMLTFIIWNSNTALFSLLCTSVSGLIITHHSSAHKKGG